MSNRGDDLAGDDWSQNDRQFHHAQDPEDTLAGDPPCNRSDLYKKVDIGSPVALWDDVDTPLRGAPPPPLNTEEKVGDNVGLAKCQLTHQTSEPMAMVQEKIDEDDESAESLQLEDVFSSSSHASETESEDDNEEDKLDLPGRRRNSTVIMKRFNESSVMKKIHSSRKLIGISQHHRWMASFRRLDPRYQILSFFDDVAQEGAENIETKGIDAESQPGILRFLNRASVFTVWRPTSKDAIRQMMSGHATGKGLEIKGKSAKKGSLSSLVPFVQIHEENHKERIRESVRDDTLRVFYETEYARNEAVESLSEVVETMSLLVQEATNILLNPDTTPQMKKHVLKLLQWDGVDHKVKIIDDFAPDYYGIEVTERLFWEGYIMMQDCSRPKGSEHETGRPSEPAFQDMNFNATRHVPKDPSEPRPVVFQTDSECPMSPRTLVMAYQENGRVLPVVSDFDCFLLGTRGVRYDRPLPPEQVDLAKWTVGNIESVLGAPVSTETWTKRWLEILKQEAMQGFYPETPRFGYGDPKSYSIMANAIGRLHSCGAVRHGAECFNYYFPQELDDEFLVISDTLPGKVPWKYVSVEELQELLLQRVEEGFTFPLNPKWVLCDPGWKRIYDKLLASQARNVRQSVDIWFPPESGIREHIEKVYCSHPNGFVRKTRPELTISKSQRFDGAEQMENSEAELEKFIILERVKQKIRARMLCLCLAKSLPSAKANEKENAEKHPAVRLGLPDEIAMLSKLSKGGSVPLRPRDLARQAAQAFEVQAKAPHCLLGNIAIKQKASKAA